MVDTVSPHVAFSEPDFSCKVHDWMVGDRVWVDGISPGYIQYLGEVHFGDGDWAGVVLDEPIGRNAGSVNGRRYFYCEPKRGLFTRPHRLTRFPLAGKFSPDSGIMADDGTILRRRTFRMRNASSSPTVFERYRSRSSSRYTEATSGSGGSMGSPLRRYDSLSPSPERRFSSYNSSVSYGKDPSKTIHTTVTTASTILDGTYKPGPLRLGDKVFVNSSKGLMVGKLRYMGSTSFARGQWAGVELDEPLGKNDGQVAGRR